MVSQNKVDKQDQITPAGQMPSTAIDTTVRSVVLLQEGDCVVTQEDSFNAEIIEFLDRITWGTESNLFQHIDTADRIRNLLHPRFIMLRIKEKVAATLVIEQREVRVQSSVLPSYYFRYFASDVSFRDRRLVGLYSRKFMRRLLELESNPAIYYGAVEDGNFRSKNINIKLGYESIARVKMLGFSRFFPRDHQDIKRANTEDLQFIRSKLLEKYQGYGLYHDNYVGHRNNYFVWKRRGQIVAGLQAFHATWTIQDLPGILASFAIKYGGKIPFFKRVFDPSSFRFLAIDSIYCEDEDPSAVLRLLEAVLAREKRHTALMWFDQRHSEYQKLAKMSGLGVINRFARNATLDLFVALPNFSPEQTRGLKSSPVYMSSFDFI